MGVRVRPPPLVPTKKGQMKKKTQHLEVHAKRVTFKDRDGKTIEQSQVGDTYVYDEVKPEEKK